MSGDEISNKEIDSLLESQENLLKEDRQNYEHNPFGFALKRFNNQYPPDAIIKINEHPDKIAIITVLENATIKNGVLAFKGYITDDNGNVFEPKMYSFKYDPYYKLIIDGYK